MLYKELRFCKSFSGFHSQASRASKVKSVSARIFRRNGFSSCIHGMPGERSTSMTNSFISRPSGSMRGAPTDIIRARPERNRTPSALNKSSFSWPAAIVIRVPGRREPSGRNCDCNAANEVPVQRSKMKKWQTPNRGFDLCRLFTLEQSFSETLGQPESKQHTDKTFIG